METLTLQDAIKTVMKIEFQLFASDFIKSFSLIITREFMSDFSIAILRSLDPGIEFLYMLTKVGLKTLMNSWRFIKNKFSSTYVESTKIVSILSR